MAKDTNVKIDHVHDIKVAPRKLIKRLKKIYVDGTNDTVVE